MLALCTKAQGQVAGKGGSACPMQPPGPAPWALPPRNRSRGVGGGGGGGSIAAAFWRSPKPGVAAAAVHCRCRWRWHACLSCRQPGARLPPFLPPLPPLPLPPRRPPATPVGALPFVCRPCGRCRRRLHPGAEGGCTTTAILPHAGCWAACVGCRLLAALAGHQHTSPAGHVLHRPPTNAPVGHQHHWPLLTALSVPTAAAPPPHTHTSNAAACSFGPSGAACCTLFLARLQRASMRRCPIGDCHRAAPATPTHRPFASKPIFRPS